MFTTEHVLGSIVSLFETNRLIHISGEPGTGKSILA